MFFHNLLRNMKAHIRLSKFQCFGILTTIIYTKDITLLLTLRIIECIVLTNYTLSYPYFFIDFQDTISSLTIFCFKSVAVISLSVLNQI